MEQIIDSTESFQQALAIAWAAGFVDGEGCLSLARSIQSGRKNPTYRPRLALAQNNREVLVRFREIVGEDAGLYELKRQPCHSRQPYGLTYDGIHAVHAVAKLRPYLVRKALEADVLLAYPDLGQMGALSGPNGFPEEVWAARERLYRLLRDLK